MTQQNNKNNKMQHNATSRGNAELDQKLHGKNWSKTAAHLSPMLEILIALSQTVHLAFVLDFGLAAIQALNSFIAFHLSEKTHLPIFTTKGKYLIDINLHKCGNEVCPMIHCERTVTMMQCRHMRVLRLLSLRLNVFAKDEIK